MADVAAASSPPWRAGQSRTQWVAVVELRWHIFRNGLARRGSIGEWIGSLFLYLFLAALFIVPVVGGGIGAFYMAHAGRLDLLSWLLWGVFGLTQIVNTNLGQAGTTFDPNQLIRFPVSARQFVLLRLFFGLLSPGNILVALMSGAVALGLTIALPRLWLFVSVVLLVFTLVNILFSRMVFAWVDRWLSTRRAREVFTALIFVGSIGLQYLNLRFNTGALRGEHRAANTVRWRATGQAYARARPALDLLPPELTAASIRSAQAGRGRAFAGETLGCAAYGALFLAMFAWRMREEFRGEFLSDSGIRGAETKRPAIAPQSFAARAGITAIPGKLSRFALPPGSLAVAGKDLLYARRNPGQFYGILSPFAMTLLFARQMMHNTHSVWAFPGVFAYTLLAITALSCNSFGLDGTGIQLYILAPVRMRDVVLGKNLVALGLSAIYVVAAFAIVSILVGIPGLALTFDCLLWAATALLACTALGNLRSIAAPKRIDLNKIANRQASPLSAFMSVGLAIGTAAVGASFVVIGRAFHLPWFPPLAFTGLFAGALAVYLAGLRGIDTYAMTHREGMIAELCRP